MHLKAASLCLLMNAVCGTRGRYFAAALMPFLAFALASSRAFPQAAASRPSASDSPIKAPAQFADLSRRAQTALDADELDKAIPLLRKALALNPRWAEGWWSLGTSYYDQGRYAEGELAFQRVVALDPRHGTAHAFLGLCQFELGDDKDALQNIELSRNLGTSIDPQLRDVVLYHEGVLLQRAGHFIGAQGAFSSLCLGGTRSEDVVRAFGMASLHMADREAPLPNTESGRAVELVGRAACLAAQKDVDSARRLFSQAIESYPQVPYVHYAFGRELVDEHDTAGAVAQFKDELALGHDRVQALLQIAAAEYKIDSAAGLPYAERAVALAPHLPFAHFLYGLLLMNTGAYAKALPELEAASKGLPRDPKVWWALGSAYEQSGRSQDAAKARARFAVLKQEAARQAQSPEAQEVPVNVPVGSDVTPKDR